MIKWFKKLFKKKSTEVENVISKPKRLKMDDVNFKFNIKSICYFETLTDKSFFEITDEDIFDMLYSIYMVNNPDKMLKRETFMNIIQRRDILTWMINEYSKFSEIISQFKIPEQDNKSDNIITDDTKKIRISDYVSTLIIEHGVDPHYIYYEMDIWEIPILFEAIDTKIKKELTDKRFWTYMSISPHIDTKKCKTPEDLISFEWEKENKKKNREQELKNNAFAIKNMLGKSIFGYDNEE